LPSVRFAAVLVTCAGWLSATPITGRLILNGTSLSGVNLTTTDFNYSGSGVPSDLTYGSFLVGPGSTGSFASYVGDTGAVRSFNRADVPLGVPTAYSNFITIPSPSPNIEFVLTKLIPGGDSSTNCAAAPAAGQTCTPPIPGGSPFELSNSSNGEGGFNTHVDFNVDVEAINLTTGETSNGEGTFSTDFSDTDYQQLLATIAGGGTVTSGDHGDFTIIFSATPEPTSSALMGGGLLLVAAALRRKLGIFRKRR
jgi:hypothetical protein